MKMAKPKAGEMDRVFRFLQGVEAILERDQIPIGSGDDYDERDLEDAEDAMKWLSKAWPTVAHSWQRVLIAGEVAIDNACDPNESALEFKPEIKAALELPEKLETLLKALIERECTCRAKSGYSRDFNNTEYLRGLADGAKDAAADLAKIVKGEVA